MPHTRIKLLSWNLLYLLFFLSGAAALGYQLIWSKIFGVGLGHEMASVLGVICAFMGGMSLGAWFSQRVVAFAPMRTFAVIELIIGIWGATTALILPPVNDFALHVSGLGSPVRQWLVCFLLPFVVLLPATMAMGASFPVMERCVSASQATRQTVAGVYAANTFGAVFGIYLSIFVIAPVVGFTGSLFCLATINMTCAAAAFVFALRMRGGESETNQAAVQKTTEIRRAHRATLGDSALFVLFFSGMLGMATETVGVRVLSQILENTVYTFAAVLAVFLLGMAVGAVIYHWRAKAGRDARASRQLLSALFCGLGLSCLLTIVLLDNAPAVYAFARNHLPRSELSMIGAETLVAASTLALPSLLMGATFTLLAQAWRDLRGNVSFAAGINTAGAALAPFVFNVLILPWVGAKEALIVLGISYFSLVPGFTRKLIFLSSAVAGITFAFMPPDLHLINWAPEDKRVREYRDGIMAAVAVVEDVTHNRTLRVNNHFQMGGTGAADAEYRHAHIPLLLHRNPKRALILGVGTGITLGGATLHPDLKIDGVELLPEVIDVMPQFEPYNRSPQQNPSVHIQAADARRFIKLTPAKYDVVIADLFHPAADGAGNLYTLEHFRSIRDHLQSNGLFCQWLPLHQLDLPTFRVITKTFLEIFPNTHAWLLRFNIDAPVVGLIGTMEALRYPTNWIEQRLTANPVETEIKRLSLADSIRFFGNYLADPKELRSFCADAPLNTDNHPIVLFRAPEFAYQTAPASYGRLAVLLRELKPNPNAILQPDSDQFAARLRAYFAARDKYINGLIAETENHPDEAIDAFIESARLSEDFTPGYAQCLSLASVQARSNPASARRLLERLIEAQPARPVAREMLNRLSQPQR